MSLLILNYNRFDSSYYVVDNVYIWGIFSQECFLDMLDMWERVLYWDFHKWPRLV